MFLLVYLENKLNESIPTVDDVREEIKMCQSILKKMRNI